MADVDELREDVQEARDLVRATNLHEVIYNRMVWQDQSMTLQDAKAGLLMLAAPLLLLADIAVMGTRMAWWQAGALILALAVIAASLRVLGPWPTKVVPNPDALIEGYHDADTCDTLRMLAATHAEAFTLNRAILDEKGRALGWALKAFMLLAVYSAACVIIMAVGGLLHG